MTIFTTGVRFQGHQRVLAALKVPMSLPLDYDVRLRPFPGSSADSWEYKASSGQLSVNYELWREFI